MKASTSLLIALGLLAGGALLVSAPGVLRGQQAAAEVPVLEINAAKAGPRVSPMLYGLMTEEINFSYDGGLYAELVRNRNFKENEKEPVYWQLVQEGGGAGSMALDPTEALNEAMATSLKLTITEASGSQRVGIANEGFWGIPVRPSTRYRASFYAKASPEFKAPLTVAIVSNEGGAIQASARVAGLTGAWKKYEVTLTTTAKAGPSAKNRLLITTNGRGTVWFSLVSLFPPTYNNRPNGNRRDIMQLLADMKPAFLRFPGGNYLEGNTIATRFDWKKTIGDISQRPGHLNDAWRYWSSDGMGLLEFLEWCEDLKIEPVLGVYAGYSLRQQRVKPGPDLEPYVQEALEEIEYVTGGSGTTWGARRAKDGHPAPFRLQYVEVGNEDQFDREQGSYDGRFAQFFDAIKAKYPQLKVISTTRVTSRVPDVIDEHYYRRSEEEMASHAYDYDSRPRTGPKVFVGEWATRVGEPTPNMSAALGDAAWMTGMERNSDLVIMSAYAPLFVNVSPGAMQWRTDLIGYDALTSYGSPAYYAQKMFSNYHGDVVLPVTARGIPTRAWQPPAPPARAGQTPGAQPATPPPAPSSQQVPTLFYNATRDTATGTIYLKIVNRAGTPQPVRVQISGLNSVDSKGQAVTLSAGRGEETNSITAPAKIVPVTSGADGLGTSFTRAFPPYSITVLQMKAR
jgi:alpha-N-arabinofuranosidase